MHGRHVDGAALRTLREMKGFTRTKLVRLSGVSLSWLKAIEMDGRQPSGVKAYALAQTLGVHVDAFTTPLVREQDAA